MYRPKGWKQCIEVRDDKKRYTGTELNTAFEAGADAMLEGLFKLAKESPTGTFVIDSNVINVFSGVNDN